MMVLGNLDGQFSRFALWTLGPGKPRLHFRKEALQARGVSDVRVSGEAWEVSE